MPAYEYECRDCGEHFEQRQKMSEPEVAECPGCGGPVKRLISGGAGVVSKGGASSAAPRPCQVGEACPAPAMGCGAGCLCAH